MARRRLTLQLIVAAAAAACTFAAPVHSMPFLVPATIAGSALLAGVVSTAVGVALSIGVSFVMQALFKPAAARAAPMESTSQSVDNKFSVKQAAAARRVIYGRTRVGGIYAAMMLSNRNGFLTFPLMLAGHLCEEIESIWIDDAPQSLSGTVVNSGRYANAAYFEKHLGEDTQTVSPLISASNPEWTPDCRLQGICYIACGLFWDNTTGTGNPNNGTWQILNLGAKLWPGGPPNVTAIVKGKKVYDPRTGETAYSTNSALIVADYLCDSLYGYGADYETEIDEEALIVAANICDELVSKKSGGTEKRYETNGSFDTDQPRDELLGRLLGAMHGRAAFDGERWVIFAGAWSVPTIDLTDDELRAPAQLKALASSADAFNAVKGTFFDPTQNWQQADFPAVESDTFRAQDGQELWNDIELPFTGSASACQRIGKIQLLRSRQEIIEKYPGMLSCWRVLAGTNITRTSALNGWSQKPFEVDSVSLVFEEDKAGNIVLGVDLVLIETAESVWDWETDEESEVDPAPNSNFGDIFTALPVSNVQVAEYLYEAPSGAGVQVGVRVSWDASEDAAVRTGGTYRLKYRKVDAVLWILRPLTTFISDDLPFMQPGDYYFEVEAVNYAGNPSPAVRVMATIVGLTAKPDAPTDFSVVPVGGVIAYLRWTPVDDLDVLKGGTYVVKHSPLTDGSHTWEDALPLVEDIPGDANSQLAPLVPGTYMIKAKDSTENYSETFAAIVQFQSSVLEFTPVSGGSLIEDPGFTGAKDGTVEVGGLLVLDAAGEFDDVDDVDSIGSWDYTEGGAVAEGTYSYSAIMELPAVTRVRLTNICEAVTVNLYDQVDGREMDVDAWDDWDGAATGGEVNSWLMVEWTDDPVGPGRVWQPPVRLHAGIFEMKAARFVRYLQSSDSAFTPAIVHDAVFAEEVV